MFLIDFLEDNIMTTLELAGERVLTTGQLAELCGVTSNKVNLKLSKNRDSFQSSDYRLLTGTELEQIKVQLQKTSKAGSMKVWTFEGATKMAHLLGNEKVKNTLNRYYQRLFPFGVTNVQKDNIEQDKLLNVIVTAMQTIKQDSEKPLIDEMKERIKLLEKIVAEKDTQIKDSTELQATLAAQNGQYLTIIQQLLSK